MPLPAAAGGDDADGAACGHAGRPGDDPGVARAGWRVRADERDERVRVLAAVKRPGDGGRARRGAGEGEAMMTWLGKWWRWWMRHL